MIARAALEKKETWTLWFEAFKQFLSKQKQQKVRKWDFHADEPEVLVKFQDFSHCTDPGIIYSLFTHAELTLTQGYMSHTACLLTVV